MMMYNAVGGFVFSKRKKKFRDSKSNGPMMSRIAGLSVEEQDESILVEQYRTTYGLQMEVYL